MYDQTMRARLRPLLICIVALSCCSWLFSSSAVLGAGSISQGFKTTDSSIAPGTLVSRNSSSHDTLEPANTNRVERLIGVVGEKPLIELSGGDQEAQVVISGLTSTFVSDINGEIKTGDKITASPINGVGMKAIEETQIVGTAQAPLSESNSTKQTITDRNKKTETVKVGTVPVQVGVTYYAPEQSKLALLLPNFLQVLANGAAGKSVSPLRALLSVLVLLLGFVTAAIILYSSVRSSMTSIGRNPLARSALLRGLLEVLLTAGGILIITAVVVYLILTS